MFTNLFDVDWKGMFDLDTPFLEIVLRGTIMYLTLFLMLRIVLKREAGSLGLPDILLVALIADAAQNGMADDYHSISDGVLLVATLVFWNYVLDWLGYHVAFVGKLVHPPPILLVKDGKLQRKQLRAELITEEELLGLLRQQGVSDLSHVKEARMEEDGGVSVIKRKESE